MDKCAVCKYDFKESDAKYMIADYDNGNFTGYVAICSQCDDFREERARKRQQVASYYKPDYLLLFEEGLREQTE